MEKPKLKKKPGPRRDLPAKSKFVESGHSKLCLICLKKFNVAGVGGSAPPIKGLEGPEGGGGGIGGKMPKVPAPAGVKRKRGRPPKRQRLQGPIPNSSCHDMEEKNQPTTRTTAGSAPEEVNSQDISPGVPEGSGDADGATATPKSNVFLDFLRIANRYLDIRTKSFSSMPGLNLDSEGTTPPFCEGCLHSVRKFCEVFREWERALMFLRWRLMEISEKIRHSRRATLTARYNVWCRIMSKQLKVLSPTSIDMFRKQLALRCSAKARTIGFEPKVSLDRKSCLNAMNLTSSIPVDPSLQYMKSLIVVFALANLNQGDFVVAIEEVATAELRQNEDVPKTNNHGLAPVNSAEEVILCKGEVEEDDMWKSNSLAGNGLVPDYVNSSPVNSPINIDGENDVGMEEDNLACGETEADVGIIRNEELPFPSATTVEEKSPPMPPTGRFNLRKRMKSSIMVESEGCHDERNDFNSDSSDSYMDSSDYSWDGNDSNSDKFVPAPTNLAQTAPLLDNSETIIELDSHGKDSSTTNPIPKYPCSICKQTFPDMEVLLKHCDIHKNIKKASKKAHICEICGVTRKGKLYLTRHMKSHMKSTKAKMHRCTKCSRTYKAAIYLKRHMMCHEMNPPDWSPATISQKRFKCEADGCEKVFLGKPAFEVHSTLHPSEGFKCSVCTEPFPRYQSMLSHLLNIHEKGSEEGENLHPCRHCSRSFLLEQTCDIHAKILHPGIYKLKCDSEFCSYEFDTMEKLREHLRTNHLPPDATEIVEDLDEVIQFFRPSSSTSADDSATVLDNREEIEYLGLFTCKRCGWSFPSRNELTLHLLVHRKIHHSKMTCLLCDQVDTTYRLQELQAHFVKIHGSTNTRYWCPMCQRTVSHSHMKEHQAEEKKKGKDIQMNKKKYPRRKEFHVCDECPDSQRFHSTWAALSRHKNRDHGPTIKCEFEGCPKMFFNRSEMKKHMKCHYKTIPCPLCPVKFPDNTHLKQHLRTHGQEKDHICQYCGKSFLLKHGLKMHLDIHLENKKWKCSYCDKAFCRKYAMECHERTHTKEKPFLCKFCGKGFSQQVTLKTHEKIHEKKGDSN